MNWHDKIPINIITWVLDNVTRPIAGFEHQKNSDGTFFTYDQQLRATYVQIMFVILYFLRRGKTSDEIFEKLSRFKK